LVEGVETVKQDDILDWLEFCFLEADEVNFEDPKIRRANPKPDM
jgi:hypothetical protein